ncbi:MULTISPECIES: gephyrin-like molybdotransferase Glp [unclassified Ruegeria]|uniref:molybdopterin molybdotransferase MoeA n=1 Tax=unclassified Ruegeria TaxID=2625375 RepID=UPI00148929C3|nr:MULTISPECIES: gephyrin-like molybdotransferase Glp [unclassified Ruegeria]NOD46358.1 molybdopterin molybdenumtransferase MoeA [Ruegeria sp. HKCCD5849]NOD50342.1 molybdopterin molybdenumtransferase MoeA [Ruegeria sp. HKCCD5851]NOD67158.1 molybdopterin molybdenumtransferase MoeA [Ruegeria sp. HKCCD7303]
MITVEEARALLFDLVGVLPSEEVPLAQSAGRVLARDVVAGRNQPPFAASSMDGYAVKAAEVELHAMFKVVGESAAGHRFDGQVGPGQAVRIFTGAPVPEGADFVIIQEDTDRRGDLITITDEPGPKTNIRPAGVDFEIGTSISAPRLIRAEDVALMAAMNTPRVTVARKPVIALISTGDELVMPGEEPGPDQIIASNTFGLQALLEGLGASVRVLPIARDTVPSLETAFGLAHGADLVVTIGGASVGDYDLVADVSQGLGMERSFYKIRMRPGKPLMAGRIGETAMVGLPGNPVSAMVCGYLFLAPMVRRMLGLDDVVPTFRTAQLTAPLSENGPREHYMRAVLSDTGIEASADQDSSLLSVLAQANALLVRQPHDPAREIGETVQYLPI